MELCGIDPRFQVCGITNYSSDSENRKDNSE